MSKARNFYKFYSSNSPYLINSLEAGLFADSYFFSKFDIQNDKMEGTIVPVRLEPVKLKRAVIDHLNELGIAEKIGVSGKIGYDFEDFSKFSLTPPEEFEEQMLEIFGSMARNASIYCMCENWNNQTMWAHYANASNGICLELNYRIIDPLGQRLNAPSAVTYRDVPQEFSVLEVMNMMKAIGFHWSGKKGSRDFIRNSLRKFNSTLYQTKHIKFSFEQEWRSVNPSEGPGLLKIPGLSIKSVLLGTNCSDALASTLYGRFGKTVKFERIVQLSNSYELSRQPYAN